MPLIIPHKHQGLLEIIPFSQPVFNCSKLTMETPVNNKGSRAHFLHCSRVLIVYCEQVNTG